MVQAAWYSAHTCRKSTSPKPAGKTVVDFDDSDLVADATALVHERTTTASPTAAPRIAFPSHVPPGTAFGSLMLARHRLHLPQINHAMVSKMPQLPQLHLPKLSDMREGLLQRTPLRLLHDAVSKLQQR
jgi:hypothetical protein